MEPSLDELLADEVMEQVMRSAGLSAGDLRTLIAAAAERIAAKENSRRRAID
ncbi:MAG: hypothetical protein ACREFD_13150 [Stellaceae bacterium]